MKLTTTIKNFKNNIIGYFSNNNIKEFKITDIAFYINNLNTSSSNYYNIPINKNNIYVPISRTGDTYDNHYFNLSLNNPIGNRDEIISLYIPVYTRDYNFNGVRLRIKFNNSNPNSITFGQDQSENHLYKVDIKNAEILKVEDIGKLEVIT